MMFSLFLAFSKTALCLSNWLLKPAPEKLGKCFWPRALYWPKKNAIDIFVCG